MEALTWYLLVMTTPTHNTNHKVNSCLNDKCITQFDCHIYLCINTDGILIFNKCNSYEKRLLYHWN